MAFNTTEEEIDFSRKAAIALYYSGEARTINPERWERIRRDVPFEDIVDLLTGRHGQSISCPFHGRDSRPSFYLYRGTNDGYCFGCPKGYYDAIRFTSELLNISRVQALKHLEKQFNLPKIDDLIADEEEELEVDITFTDLSPTFIAMAAKDIQQVKDPSIAEEYLAIYFRAQKLAGTDQSKQDQVRGALLLAQVLGNDTLDRIKVKKAYK